MKSRSEIEDKYKWKLEDIFSSVEKLKESILEIEEKSKLFEAFKGKLKNPKTLRECLNLADELKEEFNKVFLYACLKADEDTRIGENQALVGKVMSTMAMINSSLSFIEPELIEIGEKLKTLVKEEGLYVYEKFFDDLIRKKNHTLDASKEELMAVMGEMTDSASNIFMMINNADMNFEDAIDSKGESHKLTHSSSFAYLESYDRELRSNVYDKVIKEYVKRKNSIGQTFLENLKKDRIIASIRNYNSSLEMKLGADNIPVSVYENLLDSVDDNRAAMHKLSLLRKKVLGVESLYNYDMAVPLIKDADNKISYDDAILNVANSLKLLGDEYYENVKIGFENGWIDVYETEGKQSGAYSWATKGVHPFILINYNGTVSDMFTLTHEMGHAMHSYFTNKTQPNIYASYSAFLAEIAATVNEGLLHEYLMETTVDNKKRTYLVNERINSFVRTFFRQATFAAFEKRSHELAKSGQITIDELNKIFEEEMKKEFGDEVNFAENSELGWMRIPHFYNGFYVYQYPIGFATSIAIIENIKKKGQKGINDYFKMLKGGSSKYPIDLLKEAGVDLTTKAPIEAALKNFSNLVDELETLLEV